MGNLLEVGIGKITIEELKFRLLQKDRKLSAPAAESTGLYLQEVVYPKGLLIEF